jgi:hypothetical protein
MAIVNANNTVLNINELATIVTNTASGAEGVAVKFTNKDDKRVLLLIGGAAGAAKIEKGDMLQATEDLAIAVTAADKAIVIETGKYMKADGTVVISGLSGITVKAIELP